MNENFKTFYLFISGSRAYGTNTKDSDIDYRGIAFPNKTTFFGLNGFEQYESKPPAEDKLIYSFNKFISLALAANPNILEFFFVPDGLIIQHSHYASRLRDLREFFITKRIFKTYLGYADAQLNKMINQYAKDGAYNPKAAMHLMRLLYQCEELAKEKKISLPLKKENLETCIAIRSNQFTFEQVTEMAEVVKERLRTAEKFSTLPANPPFGLIDKFVVDTNYEFYTTKTYPGTFERLPDEK